ncbi:Werner syndrome ATP-dependent helicase homolog [Papaver somniferum]|uniref:Werner syndrome ATP-dependent helicase homolog n=1 Tax=Papaver somniferum TaxID=3469 RepID=UPI000E6FE1A9|nr:Werner syndrome ATP-dependent helicase homolog [Papaver somniferum]
MTIRTLPNYYPDTQDLYSVTVDGVKIKTTVTKDAATVDDWIEQVYSDYKDTLDRCTEKESRQRFIVALDVEWKPPAFGPYHEYPAAILQLCVGRRCLIFQILRSDKVPRSLHWFLEDENLRFVGVGIEDVAFKLEMDFDICLGKAVDLRDLVAGRNYRRKEYKTFGLMGLARAVFRSGEIEKPADVSESNWSQKYLTQPQIESACVDAYVSFKIGNRHRFTYGYTILD